MNNTTETFENQDNNDDLNSNFDMNILKDCDVYSDTPDIVNNTAGYVVETTIENVGKFWYPKKSKKDTQDTQDNQRGSTKGLIINMLAISSFFEEHYIAIDCETIYRKTYNYILQVVNPIEVAAHLNEEAIKEDITGHGAELIKNSLTIERRCSTLVSTLKRCTLNDKKEFLPLPSYRDDDNNSYIPYRNGLVHVTKDTCDVIPYDKLDKYLVIPTKTITMNRDFHVEDIKAVTNSDFYLFLQRLSLKGTNDLEANEYFNTTKSLLGYLINTNKIASNAKAVLLTDKLKYKGKQSGRAGKSLIGDAVSHIRETVCLNADNFDENNRFKFQECTPTTKLMFFDDIKKHLEFAKFKTYITGSFGVEAKRRDAFTIPFEDSPKLLFSTNYIPKDINDSSIKDRVYEITFDNYYNIKHRPIDEFGKVFFSYGTGKRDWNDKDWSLFDNVMVNCVQQYLTCGVTIKENNRDMAVIAGDLQALTSIEFVNTLVTVDDNDTFKFLNKPFMIEDMLMEYLNTQDGTIRASKSLEILLGNWTRDICDKLGLTKNKFKKQSTGSRQVYHEIVGDFDWKALKAVLDEV